MSDVNPGFRPDSVEDAHGGVCGVCVENRDGPVDRYWGGSKVLEYVSVVQAVRVAEEGRVASSSGEGQSRGMLRDTVNCTMVRKRDIQGKRFRT